MKKSVGGKKASTLLVHAAEFQRAGRSTNIFSSFLIHVDNQWIDAALASSELERELHWKLVRNGDSKPHDVVTPPSRTNFVRARPNAVITTVS